ncbi:MAG: ABC transporter substrate-binding protein [Anaerolinea sp.]|nr:ABC transporter substrate-binding protein [Anaerolinea sp.]
MLLGSTFRLHNKRLSSLLLLILILALTACGGASDNNTPAQTSNNTTTADSAPTDTADTAAMSRSGVLRVAMQPVVNLDPIAISSDSEVLFANHIYDYLVDVDAQSNPVPRLATEWAVSDDGRTYTFQLAPGVTWHDGSPFTAADVVWTFDRLRQTEGAPTADLYANIAAIAATGDLEVTFTLTNPNPFFLYDLSDNHALVLKADTADANTAFNGTGPFKVASYTPEDRIVMTANEAYFIPDQPQLAGLEIIFFNDDTAAIEALRGGQIDLAMRMSSSLFQSLQGEPGITTIDIPTNGFDLIRLRSDRAPGNDPRVIQALKLATDREAIFNVVQQGYGAIGNDSPIGPLYAAYHAPAAQPPARDVEAARALLAEAGYDAANPLRLTLHTPDTGGRPDLAAVLKAQWAEAGVEIDLSVEPESVYYGDDGWLEVDLGITGWGSRPYPQFYLDVMLISDAKWNESHFADTEFDALARLAGSTLDEAERIQAYADMQALLIERGPVIIPYYFAQFAAVSDQFDGFTLKAFAGRTDFRTVAYTGK